MRITKTFEIEGVDKEFMVRELKVKEILGLISDDSLDDLSIDKLKDRFANKFLPLCSNIKLTDIENMTPSELEVVWEKFKEANKSFFGMAQKMGLEDLLMKLKEGIIADFSKSVANLSKQDI